MTVFDSNTPIIVGEVLFDCFPDGTSILGGAPFNVAWHLQGFGLSPLMISSVGDDDHGKMVLEAMREWGMEIRGIQLNREYPTGEVTVSLQDGQPKFDIRTDQAYDHIDGDMAAALLRNNDYSLLYHGSLISRTAHSRNMLDRLIDVAGLPTFVDINLRSPWWIRSDVQHALRQANYVKLNEDELLTIMEVASDSTTGLFETARELLDVYDLELLVVTQGEYGAFCISRDDMITGAPVQANVVDTVGAGDSFAAVMILGLTFGWPLATTLERALEFAATICEQRGATAMNYALYENYMKKWSI